MLTESTKAAVDAVKTGQPIGHITTERRKARLWGTSCVIVLPRECAGRIYTRIYNAHTGEIVLVPDTDAEAEPNTGGADGKSQ